MFVTTSAVQGLHNYFVSGFNGRSRILIHENHKVDMTTATGSAAHATFNLSYVLAHQNGHRFADNIFKCIFMNEKFHILIQMTLKFVPKVSIDNSPALA